MAETNLPDYSLLWSGGGDILKPSDSKITTGWAAEIPPRQWFNWLDNRQDTAILHIAQHGISRWSPTIEYQAFKSYVQDDSGNIFVAKVTHTGVNPVGDTSEAIWLPFGKKLSNSNYSVASTTAPANAYAATFSPANKVLSDGLRLYVKAPSGNTSVTPTFSPDGLPAKTIVKGANIPLHINDILNVGQIMVLQYSSSYDRWILLNPNVPATVLTSLNDTGYLDDSPRPVSSNWLKNGLASIAQYAGFAVQYGNNGYIKFPSWLGSIIIQWGMVGIRATGVTSATAVYPIAYTNQYFSSNATIYNDTADSTDIVRITTSPTPLQSLTFRLINSNGGTVINWWSVGR